MLQPIPLVGASGNDGPDFDAQLTENMLVERGEAGSKSPASLVGRPGHSTRYTLSGTAVIGLKGAHDSMHMMAVTSGGTTAQGTIFMFSNPFTFSSVGNLAGSLIANSTDPYAYVPVQIACTTVSGARPTWAITGGVLGSTGVGALQFVAPSGVSAWTLTSSAYPNARGVVHADHRFVFLDELGDIRHTDLNSTTINALNVLRPGVRSVAIQELNREIWVFGTDGIEVYYNAGTSGFVYARQDGATFDSGVHSASAIAKMDGTLYWLSRESDGRVRVMRANGYQAEAVSTPFVEKLIYRKTLGLPEHCVAWSHSYGSHNCLILSFGIADFSLCFDSSTGDWSTIGYTDDANVMHRHDGIVQEYFYSMSLVGSRDSAKVLRIDESTTDDGKRIVKRRRLGRVSSATSVRHKKFELRAKTGIGTPTVEDPKVMLRWSDDGGRTFSNERVESLGPIGDYVRRVAFRRLGSARDRVYELTVSDPVDVTMIETLADMEGTRT